MIINSIEMTNWKCFDHKKVEFSDGLTTLNWKNGEGKTSVIQAIVLCLFDKRPDGLDYDSLVDKTKETKIVLKFTHNFSSYVIEREVGFSSAFRLYKDDVLLARKNAECKEILAKIIPESVLTSLWGYESLSVSHVLNSSYLYSILEAEFKEPLELKQYFTSDRTFQQKKRSSLEKTITNQTVTKEEVDNLKRKLADIEAKIKEKAYISDGDVVRAKKAKEDFAEYNRLMAQLAPSVPIDRETCLRLRNYGKNRTEYTEYFRRIHSELDAEKHKAQASPLTKYPRSTISSLINESKNNNCTCILCGGKFVEPHIDYDTIDNDKIQRLEKILEDERYSYDDLYVSMQYWHIKMLIGAVEYSKDVDFDKILKSYNAETNALYDTYEQMKNEVRQKDQDLAQIDEFVAAKQAYELDKKCIDIVEEYIAQAKAFYADKIIKRASELICGINSRYSELLIDNGVYKARVLDKDYQNEKLLAVQSLSKGEKTLVALALILTIRDLFMPQLPLIMDESFSNLDAENLDSIRRMIFQDTNQWIIVSHDERLAVR